MNKERELIISFIKYRKNCNLTDMITAIPEKIADDFFENRDDEPMYLLEEDTIHTIGSRSTKINDKISAEELFGYRIVDREDFIDELIRWISEAKGNDKLLMKQDLEMLMGITDDYIFSSVSTNEYIYAGCSDFNDTCKELLELNESVS